MIEVGSPCLCIHPGNTNEQTTLIPLEEQILRDFSLSKFIVCTDAGLSSERNRKFNNFGGRCFITTQSIKKLKKDLRQWCLEPTGWHLKDSLDTYDISRLEDTAKTAAGCSTSSCMWKEMTGNVILISIRL